MPWQAEKTASRSLPAGAKESCRWLEGYARLAEQASLLPETRLVYVADRESDFLDWMVQASALGTPVDWLIRSAYNRKLVGQEAKLWDGFAKAHAHLNTPDDEHEQRQSQFQTLDTR